MLEVHENEIALRKLFDGTAQLPSCAPNTDCEVKRRIRAKNIFYLVQKNCT